MKLLVLGFLSFLPLHAFSQSFSLEQVRKSVELATEELASRVGQENITAFTVSRTADGSSIKIRYKQDEQAKDIMYFCHFHNGAEIDCHSH